MHVFMQNSHMVSVVSIAIYVGRFEKTDHAHKTSEMHFVAPYHTVSMGIFMV